MVQKFDWIPGEDEVTDVADTEGEDAIHQPVEDDFCSMENKGVDPKGHC